MGIFKEKNHQNRLKSFKGELLFRLDSTVKRKTSKFSVELDEWNLFYFYVFKVRYCYLFLRELNFAKLNGNISWDLNFAIWPRKYVKKELNFAKIVKLLICINS